MNIKEQSDSQSNTKKRPTRIPLHGRDILTVRNKNPDREYRWVNDIDDRLFRFSQAGWEFVTDKGLVVGDPTVNADKELGSVIVKSFGTTRSYLMSTSKEWYEEDQAAKALAIKESERAMYDNLNNTSDGRYGEVR
jgi:hypothetical protein